ncbi:MAG: SoxR reducing system RseC family protein [Muribaculaceae bacterium]|nr:SoxR reducing system RseC family protein [Muribaculaceae bacterium]
MGIDTREHTGKVTGLTRNGLAVQLHALPEGSDCSGCALKSTCGAASGETVTVEATAPSGIERKDVVGRTVVLRPDASAQLTATMALLGLPLVVFLVLAVAGTLLRLEQGLTGITALGGSALSYLSVSLLRKNRRPIWHIIKTADTH